MRSKAELERDSRMFLSRLLNRSLAPPDRVSVNVTLRCNLSCTMCTTCYDSPELSTDEIKGIIDQTRAWGVKVFNPLGGEPFMRADIEELLAYAVRGGFYVTVTTNGTLITERRARSIAAVPADRLHFNLSLDGDEQSHDLIRSRGMWRRAIQGFERIREADAAAGNPRRKVLANTILHAANLERFTDILDEQAALGLDGVQILTLFRAGSDTPPESANLWLQPRHIPAVESLAAELERRALSQGPSGYRIQNTVEELRFIPRYYRDELGPLEAPCWAGWKELYINADGSAIMCDGELDFLAGRFGSAREQTLRQLWQSPALRERRSVVKACKTPCIQTCYLRGSSDSGAALAADGVKMGIGALSSAVRRRVSARLPGVERHPDTVLRLELSDVCPCDWEGCATPRVRWAALTGGLPERPDVQNWASFRDRRYLDFGRGFMGFEVVRSVVQDLLDSRIQFGTLSVSWRGEPLLHPEAEPILRTLLDQIHSGGLADRLRIETDGRFLTPGLAALSAHPAAQDWIFDLDRGDGAGLSRLCAARGGAARVLLAVSASGGLDPRVLTRRFPGFAPAAGRMPTVGDRLWFRRTDHEHYLSNAEARRELARVAALLGVEADLGEEDRPRRCRALERSPTLSWDGKLTLCPRDVQLQNRVGDVTSGRLSVLWRGLEAERTAARARGVPDRALCRDCPAPWSPNHD